jgi:AcrR family transcriptional regulator
MTDLIAQPDGHELAEHHSGGRPLDASRDEALREATLELLAEIGYDRLTIDAVAARARAGKTTIYRRWSNKAELVVDALQAHKGPHGQQQGEGELPDTGSLRGDLEAIACSAAGGDSQFDTQVMIGLITALPRDPELRQVFRERLVAPRTAAMKQVFERAVSRGEISDVRNLDLLVSLFPAFVLHQLLVVGETPDADFAQLVIDDVILPLATAPAVTPTVAPRPRKVRARSQSGR